MKRFLLAFFVVLTLLSACKPDEVKPVEDSGLLPERDENTRTLVITLPEDARDSRYTPPVLTPPSEFDFGDYLPFVRYCVDCYGENGTPLYEYAILGEATDEESHGLWEELNEKYLTKTEVDGDKIIGYRRLSESEALKRFASESRVVYISEDVDTVGVFRLTETDIRTNDGVADYDLWNGEYEIFENGRSVSHYTYQHVTDYQDGGLFNYRNASYTPPSDFEYKTPFLSERQTDIHTDTDILVYQTFGTKWSYYFYSLSEKRMLLEVKVDFERDFSNRIEINQLVDGRYLIVSFAVAPSGGPDFERVTYKYDIETGERTKLLDYNYEPLLSPDGKYIAWGGVNYEHYGVNNTVREDYGVAPGIYVRRLDTGETVLYEFKNEEFIEGYDVISWVSRSALREVLE